MYLFFCAIAFALFSIPTIHRFEWRCLSVLSLLLFINKEYFDNTEQILYYLRAIITFIAAVIILMKFKKIGLYQSFILFLILGAYAALAYDVANNKHILIYHNYEAVIHGLVCCQFLGFISTIWSVYCDRHSNNNFSLQNNQSLEDI